MRVLVTGATGFVGRWLSRELRAAGHEVIEAPPSHQLDITDVPAVRAVVEEARPNAIAHLAAVSFGPDARRDPGMAMRVNVLGTMAVLDAVRRMPGTPAPVLVAGSSEVYGRPDPADLPLTEEAPTLPVSPYGLSKLAQEAVAVETGLASGVTVAVARSFNHTGPGQRSDFVIPALAGRVVAAKQGVEPSVRTGNLDVRREFLDVRDVAVAYRLLLEALSGGRLTTQPTVVNVASGRSVLIGEVVEALCRMAGCKPQIIVDETLVRRDDPPDIRGDASRLRQLTGWRPRIPFDQTLADILHDATGRSGPRSPAGEN